MNQTKYLKNAAFIDWRTLRMRRGHIAVDPGPDGGMRFVGRIPPRALVLDCQDKLVTKSFAVGHHHIYSALARGMPAPKKSPKNFLEILKYVWWNLDKKLDQDMVMASALAAGVEAAKSGATFIIDHHASPNAVPGSLHVIAQSLELVGLGHLLSYELSDRDGAARLEQGIEETDKYLQKRQGLVGLHASFTVGDRLLERAALLAKRHKTGVHVHVAEDGADQAHCRKKHSTRVLQRFKRAGVLDSPKTLLAHGLHLSDAERKIFKKSKSWLVHNPESNQNNAVGAFDPRGLGDRVLLGTDGMHSDMLASANAAYLGGQATGGLSPQDAYRRLRRVHHYLAENDFQGDGDNNLVVLDYRPPTPVTAKNWPGHVIYGLRRAHVHHVIAQGRLIVEAGVVKTVNEDKLLEFTRKQAERLWRRL